MLNQAYIFLIFIFNGLILGILFDIFRILRRTFKTNDFITYIEDAIFWILSGFIIMYSLFKFNNGELRLYIFFGIILGFLLYILTFSSIFIKINVNILLFLKKLLNLVIIAPLKYIVKLLKKLVFKPIRFIFINFRKCIKKLYFFGKNKEIKKDLSKEC